VSIVARYSFFGSITISGGALAICFSSSASRGTSASQATGSSTGSRGEGLEVGPAVGPARSSSSPANRNTHPAYATAPKARAPATTPAITRWRRFRRRSAALREACF
jgi:hypothetical protein